MEVRLEQMKVAIIQNSPLSIDVRNFVLWHRDSNIVKALVSSLCVLASKDSYWDDPVLIQVIGNCLSILGFEDEAEKWENKRGNLSD